MIEPAPIAIPAESRPQVIDTIRLIGPLGVRFGASTEAQLPHRLCIHKIKPQTNHITKIQAEVSKFESNSTEIQMKFKL